MSWNHRIINTTLIALFVLISLYMLGCSTYSVPSESKVVVAQEDLATYNPKNFATKHTNNQRSNNKLKNEDQLIIQAIFLEEYGAFKQSNEFYALLYEKTKKDEYLLKELTTAHQAGIISKNIAKLQAYTRDNPHNLQAQRLLLSFYLKKKEFKKAKNVGDSLTKQSKQAVDFELAANPYIFTGEYKKSLTYLKEAYRTTLNEDILLKIVTIQINYLQEVNKAIENLEQHRKKQGCSEKICLQLIEIYLQKHQTSKLTALYKELYTLTNNKDYSKKIIENYLVNNDLDAAIHYLEQEKINNTLLFSLYMEQKSYVKANKLSKQLLVKTNKAKWYAESAISFYESLSNKDDKTELQKVVLDFEKALQLGEKNPVYLNYYGYTLIDKELDIKKGLKVVKEALFQEPENTYFLDSFAWGHYKLNNCKEAYPAMKKVVQVEGLHEQDIIEHWNAIHEKCKAE